MKSLNSISLRNKIILAAVVVTAGIHAVIGAGYQLAFPFDHSQKHLVKQQLDFYLSKVLQELEPPTNDKMIQLKKVIGLDMIISHQGEVLSTISLPSIGEFKDNVLSKERFGRLKKIWPYPVGWSEKWWFTIVQHKELEVIFLAPKTKRSVNEIIFIFVIIAITLLITAFILAVKSWFKPLKQMQDFANELGSGHYEKRFRYDGSEEMNQLSLALNSMAEKIESHVESQERLLRDVSHELRSPLTRMKLALELLSDPSQSKRIASDLNEMEHLVNQILNSFQLRHHHHFKLEPFDFMPMIRELVAVFGDLKPGIQLISPPDELLVNGNPEKTQILVKNIIDNAIKYSQNSAKPVQIGFLADGFWVRDFGVGIPQEETKHVFEPFYRVDKSRQRQSGGFGLGLHLCKVIVEKQKGEMRLVPQEPGVQVFVTFSSKCSEGSPKI